MNIYNNINLTPLKLIEILDELTILYDINASINKDYSPIFYLCQNPLITLEFLQIILNFGADPNIMINKMLPIFYLCLNKSITPELFKILYTNKINGEFRYNNNILHYLFRNTSINNDLVQMVIDNDDLVKLINVPNIYNITPLDFLLDNTSLNIDILNLIKNHINFNKYIVLFHNTAFNEKILNFMININVLETHKLNEIFYYLFLNKSINEKIIYVLLNYLINDKKLKNETQINIINNLDKLHNSNNVCKQTKLDIIRTIKKVFKIL